MSNVIAQIPGASHRQKRDWFEAGIVQVSYGSGTDLEGFAGVGHVDKAAPVVFDWRREASFVKGSQSEGLLEISAIMKDFFLVKNSRLVIPEIRWWGRIDKTPGQRFHLRLWRPQENVGSKSCHVSDYCCNNYDCFDDNLSSWFSFNWLKYKLKKSIHYLCKKNWYKMLFFEI